MGVFWEGDGGGQGERMSSFYPMLALRIEDVVKVTSQQYNLLEKHIYQKPLHVLQAEAGHCTLTGSLTRQMELDDPITRWLVVKAFSQFDMGINTHFVPISPPQ